jgi:hypothetical protein
LLWSGCHFLYVRLWCCEHSHALCCMVMVDGDGAEPCRSM